MECFLSLQTSGISVMINGQEKVIRGTIAQFALDNLAAHSLFCLNQKFSGEIHISRYCLCKTSDIQEKVKIQIINVFLTVSVKCSLL